jgi:hypothetical protein
LMAVSTGSSLKGVALWLLDGFPDEQWERQEPYTGISPEMVAMSGTISVHQLKEHIDALGGGPLFTYNPYFHGKYLKAAGIEVELVDMMIILQAARSMMPIEELEAVESPEAMIKYLQKQIGFGPSFKAAAEDIRKKLGHMQAPGESIPEYNIRALMAMYDELGSYPLRLE